MRGISKGIRGAERKSKYLSRFSLVKFHTFVEKVGFGVVLETRVLFGLAWKLEKGYFGKRYVWVKKDEGVATKGSCFFVSSSIIFETFSLFFFPKSYFLLESELFLS